MIDNKDLNYLLEQCTNTDYKNPGNYIKDNKKMKMKKLTQFLVYIIVFFGIWFITDRISTNSNEFNIDSSYIETNDIEFKPHVNPDDGCVRNFKIK